MISRRRLPSRRALTLFEVLIATVLLSVLVGIMFVFMRQMVRSRDAAFDRAERQRIAQVIIDSVERDLMTCLVGDSVSGAGIAGNATSIRILSRSVPVHLAELGRHDPQVVGDLQRTEYRFNAQRMMLEGRRRTVQGDQRSDQSFSAIGDAIGNVRFRYYEGGQWQDEFDSLESGGFPQAVEVAVWYDDPNPSADEAIEPEVESEFEVTPDFSGNDGIEDPPAGSEFELGLPEVEAETPPDRIRVISIPDAAEDDGEGTA